VLEPSRGGEVGGGCDKASRNDTTKPTHREEPWAKGKDRYGCDTVPRDHAMEGKPALESLPQKGPTVRERVMHSSRCRKGSRSSTPCRCESRGIRSARRPVPPNGLALLKPNPAFVPTQIELRTMATAGLGPSFFCAPAGRCRCMSIAASGIRRGCCTRLFVMLRSYACVLTQLSARSALSLITYMVITLNLPAFSVVENG
jgi:hypothetical protein